MTKIEKLEKIYELMGTGKTLNILSLQLFSKDEIDEYIEKTKIVWAKKMNECISESVVDVVLAFYSSEESEIWLNINAYISPFLMKEYTKLAEEILKPNSDKNQLADEDDTEEIAKNIALH